MWGITCAGLLVAATLPDAAVEGCCCCCLDWLALWEVVSGWRGPWGRMDWGAGGGCAPASRYSGGGSLAVKGCAACLSNRVRMTGMSLQHMARGDFIECACAGGGGQALHAAEALAMAADRPHAVATCLSCMAAASMLGPWRSMRPVAGLRHQGGYSGCSVWFDASKGTSSVLWQSGQTRGEVDTKCRFTGHAHSWEKPWASLADRSCADSALPSAAPE